MNKVSNYMFHYNQHTNLWAAIPRGKEKIYWNENKERHKADGILYSPSHTTLVDFLTGNFK